MTEHPDTEQGQTRRRVTFYSRQFGECSVCRAPATHEVFGPGNAKYSDTCKRHAEQRVRELEKVHNP